MTSSLSSTLESITRETTIFFGIPTLIGGALGNILNIIVFLSLRTFRQKSCVVYLTIMSIVNIIQLTTGLLGRIMITSFNIDWTETSLFFCKFRYFVFPAASLISFTCLFFATIDQYFATSSRPRWQKWSNIKFAYYLTTFSTILWVLHGVPYLILFNQVTSFNQTTCVASNPIFFQYRLYFVSLIFIGFLPVAATIIFGSLAFHHVRTMNYRAVPLVRRELDKQLTIMVLTQDVMKFFTVLPYVIVTAISLNTGLIQHPNIAIYLRFATAISVLLYYFYFAVSMKRELDVNN